MGLFKKRRPPQSPDDEIGTRYRSDIEMSDSVALWVTAVNASYGGAQTPRTVSWNVPAFPDGYRPYRGDTGMSGGMAPVTKPDVVLAIDVHEPAGAVYLAAWAEMEHTYLTRPIVELWCVTPDDEIAVFERQRLEQNWHDSTLSRLGFIDRGLWGIYDD